MFLVVHSWTIIISRRTLWGKGVHLQCYVVFLFGYLNPTTLAMSCRGKTSWIQLIAKTRTKWKRGIKQWYQIQSIYPTKPGSNWNRSQNSKNLWENILICWKAISRRSKSEAIRTIHFITHAVRCTIVGISLGTPSNYCRGFARNTIMIPLLP